MWSLVVIIVLFPFVADERTNGDSSTNPLSHSVTHYSISNPVDDIVTAKVSFSRNSSLLSKTGRSMRLKQVLEGTRKEHRKKQVCVRFLPMPNIP